jgi:hypothetical protein
MPRGEVYANQNLFHMDEHLLVLKPCLAEMQ